MLEDRVRWNQKYETGEACEPAGPAAMLEAELYRLPKGRALDLACGPGRNALFLARHGYQVTGIDISEVALGKARAAAEARGLEVTWLEADLDTWPLPPSAFDLITCINFLDRRLFEAIPRALRPGGAVVFEALLLDPELAPGGNPTPRFRVAPNELLDAFRRQGFRILAYHEGLHGDRPTAALVARLPVEPTSSPAEGA